MKSVSRILFVLGLLVFALAPLRGQVPPWGLGPFSRPPHINPIISPNTNVLFNCPMRGIPVRWEADHTFNPAAAVKNGNIYVIYRAEDDTGAAAIGAHTSRLGLAVSQDGLHFRCLSRPVLFPADDSQKSNEWTGGCEDPRLVETDDGTYVLMYTQWNHKIPRLAVAVSKDLLHWTKYGPAFLNYDKPSKSGAIVCKIDHGELRAAKINNKYWMYWGEGTVRCASSDDLIHWEIGTPVLGVRPGKFDSALVEAGPPAVLTDKGIVLLYNGKNDSGSGDPSLAPGVYSDGQALFDANDPTHLLDRMDHPFYQPEAPFERTGQYAAGTTFIEGLVLFRGKWFLYYGCADSFVAVAEWDPGQISAN